MVFIPGIIASSIQTSTSKKINALLDYSTVTFELCSFSTPETEIPLGFGYFHIKQLDDSASVNYNLSSFSVPQNELPGGLGYFYLSSVSDSASVNYDLSSFSLPANELLLTYPLSVANLSAFRTSIYGVSSNAESELGLTTTNRPSFAYWEISTGGAYSVAPENFSMYAFLSGGNAACDASLTPLSARLVIGYKGVSYRTTPVSLKPYSSILDIPNLQLWLDATSGVEAFSNSAIEQVLDSSSNNFTVTKVGSPAQGTFSPFYPNGAVYNPTTHGGSCYFNGTNDFLTVPINAEFSFGTGDFTVEVWVNYPSFTNTNGKIIVDSRPLATNGNFWIFGLGNNGIPRFTTMTTGGVTLAASQSYPNQWVHLAVTRQSGSIKLFVNGTQEAISSGNVDDISSNGITVGSNVFRGSAPDTYFNGYMSNLRIVKGSAIYTTNFTPPTSPVTSIANTSLLLNFTNGLLLDGTADNNFASFGNAAITNTTKKYGLGAMYFDGSGDYFQAPSKAEYNLGTKDFTIECWVKFNQLTSGFDGIIDSGSTLTTANNTQWCLYRNGTTLTFGRHGGTVLLSHSTTSMDTETWYHIAITRQSNNLSMFVNGTRVATTYYPGWTINASVLRIGAIAAPYYMNGYIDDVRITRGTARYGSQTSLLLNANGTNEGNNNFIENSSSNTLSFTRNGSPTQGDLSPFVGTGGSIYFNGSSCLISNSTSELALGIGDFTIEAWIYADSTTNGPIVSNAHTGTDNNYYVLGVTSLGSVLFQIRNSAGTQFYANTPNKSVILNAWNHIVAARHSGIMKTFVNGVQLGPLTSNSSDLTQRPVVVGGFQYTGFQDYCTGYISNLRIVKGTAVYTSNFTVPTSPLTNITNTVLLLSTPLPSVVDSSNKNSVIYTLGNAQLSTGQSKFGGASLYFDGTDDRVFIPGNSRFAYGAEDFTIEFWCKFTRVTVSGDTWNPRILSQGTNASNRLQIYIEDTATSGRGPIGELVLYTTTTIGKTNTAVNDDTWHHIAFSRQNGTMRTFVDGILKDSRINSTNFNDVTTGYTIGSYNNTTTGEYLGYIDDLRIVKGAALYASDFTPPSLQLTTNVTSASVAPFTPPNEFANSSSGDSEFFNVVSLVQANQPSNELTWRDKSGNQNHAFQLDKQVVPVLSPNVFNSLSGVVFNGTNQFLTLSTPIQTSGQYTSFFVYKRAQNQIKSVSLGNSFSDNESPFLHWGGANEAYVYSGNRRSTDQQLLTGVIVGAVRKNESLFLSGQQITPFTTGWTGTKTGTVNSVGRYSNSYYHDGAIGEYVQTTCMLPDPEIRLISTSLMEKWG